nr:probable helicase MAGATAMA 3 isoform X3 [Ipomoea trifida]
MMEIAKKKGGKKRGGQGLIDIVFSWSLEDVMNKNLYKDKVKEIPDTFLSEVHYLNSFMHPLLEETRADLYSNMTDSLRNAPSCEVLDLRTREGFNPPNDLFYEVRLKRTRNGYGESKTPYEPQGGELIALSDVRPKRIEDLNRPKISYLIAVVGSRDDDDDSDWFPILSSKPIIFQKKNNEEGKKGDELFIVYLTSLVTNIRIWNSLKMDLGSANLKIIRTVLQVHQDDAANSAVEEIEGKNVQDDRNCDLCTQQETESTISLNARAAIHSFGLDDSQEMAILSCVTTTQCVHRNSVKLIWGPPGTGKTKTVASMLSVLFNMKCRSLTCAPTNIAVIGVAKRFMVMVRESLQYGSYGLGDIVLVGNKERMKVVDHEDLWDVFLAYRVNALASCVSPSVGWQVGLISMISLLEEPEVLYKKYLETVKEKDEDSDEEPGSGEVNAAEKDGLITKKDLKKTRISNPWNKFIIQTIKENKKKKLKSKKSSLNNAKCHKGKGCSSREVKIWTFDEFILKKYESLVEQLEFCMKNLYTHLPTSYISLEVVMNMVRAINLLPTLGALLKTLSETHGGLRDGFKGNNTGGHIYAFWTLKSECIALLTLLRGSIRLPNFFEKYEIQSFCLKSAVLIFSTASSSSKLHGSTPIEVVVIDEAAQLKECESTIPLHLPGLRHAVLIGDEKQLPAMVQSKVFHSSLA